VNWRSTEAGCWPEGGYDRFTEGFDTADLKAAKACWTRPDEPGLAVAKAFFYAALGRGRGRVGHDLYLIAVR
jgi:hypothetical protein